MKRTIITLLLVLTIILVILTNGRISENENE